jgi:hypothetical protein
VKEVVRLACLLGIGVGVILSLVWHRRSLPSPAEESEPFTSIAITSMSQTDRVNGLLGPHDILVAMWGGGKTGYWVQVPKSKALQAIEILRSDARRDWFYIHFGDRHPLESDAPWLVPWVDASYSEIINLPQYSSSTDIGACLRNGVIASVAQTYPKISRIAYRRDRLFESGRWNLSIEKVILEKFPDTPGGKRRSSHFQVFEGRQEAHVIWDGEPSRD